MERPHDPWTRIWSALNASPPFLLAGIAVLYLALTGYQASTRLLWVDELITVSIASQGTLPGIWHALALGADPNPPLTHYAVLLSTRVLGQSTLAIRLPSILGMLLAILALWTILRRWVRPAFAALGVLAFMATRGFDYAYEARSYAALTGFTMAALALWLSSADAPRQTTPSLHPSRLLPLAAMALCLGAALSTNYYGVLAWFPIAVGEAVLTARSRHLRTGVWIALLAATTPLVIYLPLIRHNLAQFSPHAWNRASLSMLFESYVVLVEGLLWPVLFAAAWLLWKNRMRRAPLTQSRLRLACRHPPEPHQLAAVATLCLYPVLGLSVAFAGAGIISPRCALPVCCGFGVAAALLAARIFGESPRALVLLLCGTLLWVVARQSACALLLHRQRTAFLALRDRVAHFPGDTPILLADSRLSLPLAHYSDLHTDSRLVFPIDFNAIHASESEDSGEQNLWAGRNGIFPLRVVPYTPELVSHSAAVLSRPGGWLVQSVTRDGGSLKDITSPADAEHLANLGGVFTPLADERTRLLAFDTTQGSPRGASKMIP